MIIANNLIKSTNCRPAHAFLGLVWKLYSVNSVLTQRSMYPPDAQSIALELVTGANPGINSVWIGRALQEISSFKYLETNYLKLIRKFIVETNCLRLCPYRPWIFSSRLDTSMNWTWSRPQLFWINLEVILSAMALKLVTWIGPKWMRNWTLAYMRCEICDHEKRARAISLDSFL